MPLPPSLTNVCCGSGRGLVVAGWGLGVESGFGAGLGLDCVLSLMEGLLSKMDKVHDYQQSLVLEQRYALLEMVRDANQSLDDKANSLLQVSGLVVGIVAALSLTGLGQLIGGASQIDVSGLSKFFSFFAFLLLIGSVWSYTKTVTPEPYSLPGSTDWERTLSLYVEVPKSKSFDQVLSDLFNAIDSARALNERKSYYVLCLGRLLMGQVVALTVAILAS